MIIRETTKKRNDTRSSGNEDRNKTVCNSKGQDLNQVKTNPTISFLSNIAEALGGELTVSLKIIMAKQSKSTQEFVEVKEVRGRHHCFKRRFSLRAALMTSSLNPCSKVSWMNKQLLCFNFKTFSTFLDFSIQIFVQSRKTGYKHICGSSS